MKSRRTAMIRAILAHGLLQYRNTACCGPDLCVHALMEDLSKAENDVERSEYKALLNRRLYVRMKRKHEELTKKMEEMENKQSKSKLEHVDWSGYEINILPFLAKKKITDH